MTNPPETKPAPPTPPDHPTHPPHTSHTSRTLRTHMDPATIREQLSGANHRGRLAEIEWLDEVTFRLVLPSRPMLSRLVGKIGPADGGGVREIIIAIRPHRKQFCLYLVLMLACAVLSPWLTEMFVPMYSWWWQPPMCVLSAIWIAVIWPAQSREDAADLLPTRIGQIRKTLDCES